MAQGCQGEEAMNVIIALLIPPVLVAVLWGFVCLINRLPNWTPGAMAIAIVWGALSWAVWTVANAAL